MVDGHPRADLLVLVDFRPVPLRYHYVDNLGMTSSSPPPRTPGGEPDAPMALRKRRSAADQPKAHARGAREARARRQRRSNAFSPKGGAARGGSVGRAAAADALQIDQLLRSAMAAS